MTGNLSLFEEEAAVARICKEADLQQYLGREVFVKYQKLGKPVTGILETIVAGCAIIQSVNGVYGMFPRFIERIELIT